jgi:hypothetical protein
LTLLQIIQIPSPFLLTVILLNLILRLNIVIVCHWDLHLIPFHALKIPQIDRHPLLPLLLIPPIRNPLRKVLRRDRQLTDVDANTADGAELVGLQGAAEGVGCCGRGGVDGDLGCEGVD